MKLRICAIAAIAGLLFANTLHAQDEKKQKVGVGANKHMLSISNDGIRMEISDSAGKYPKKDEEKSNWKATYAMFDIGMNMLNDNTVYTDPLVANYYLKTVPPVMRNESLFDLVPSKSVNVNIYPLMVKFRALKTHNQRLFISTGIGLQIYNFRYENDLTYTKNPNGIIIDSIPFSKNKLAVNYLNVPLMLTGKTRLYKNRWLTYGAGITAGYRLTSWNKQISGKYGKTKLHGNFDLMDYNSCLTAEFGVEGILRFYASYQLTSLYDNGIDQKPICVGLRFGGI